MFRAHLCAVCVIFAGASCVRGQETDSGILYDLQPKVAPGDRAKVSVTFEAGGHLIVQDDAGAEKKLPMNVVAKLAYQEQMLQWSADPAAIARSVRHYSQADATLKVEGRGAERELAGDRRLVVAEIADYLPAMNGLEHPLTREQLDLIEVTGNTLALDRLLPKKELGEGQGWDHDGGSMGEFLGMDHVSVCDVRSVVTGEENRQVQVRMGGTIHGSIEGAATVLEVKGAYLYHLDRGRITKLNLAINERRSVGEVTPGLDVTAKLSIIAAAVPEHVKDDSRAAEILEKAAAMSTESLRQLLVDAPRRGYRFRCDAGWYETAQQRELMSLRLIDEGQFLAHCNIATQPARSGPTSVQQFEREVSQALGDKLSKVEAAKEWETPRGHRCIAIFASGAVNEVPMQWRYYQLSGKDLPQVIVSVTVEQSQLERFADAERAIIDSMELVPTPTVTAVRPAPVK